MNTSNFLNTGLTQILGGAALLSHGSDCDKYTVYKNFSDDLELPNLSCFLGCAIEIFLRNPFFLQPPSYALI